MMAGRASAAHHQAMPRLFTVGEVGDHRSADDLWLLVDAEGGGYDVYDATGEYIAFETPSAPDCQGLGMTFGWCDDSVADSFTQIPWKK